MSDWQEWKDKKQWKHLFKADFIETIQILPDYLRHPKEVAINSPRWDWPQIFIFQVMVSMICGVLSNLLASRFFAMFFAVVVAPLSSIFIVMIFTGFLFYTALFIWEKELDFQKLYHKVLLCSLPLIFVQIVSGVFPPINLLGLLFSGYLIYWVLLECFYLPKKPVRNLLMFLGTVCVIFWVFQWIEFQHNILEMRHKATPKSLDLLEEELNQ